MKKGVHEAFKETLTRQYLQEGVIQVGQNNRAAPLLLLASKWTFARFL
jgi:hypothetical protein